MRSGPQALKPDPAAKAGQSDDDFEEDTLLPPPAPGLLPPSAEHLFDPPTWPGVGVPIRTGQHAARLAASSGTPMSARTPSARHSGPAPLPLAPSSVTMAEEPSVAEHLGEHLRDPDPTPRLAAVLASSAGETADALPPLPAPPPQGAATALLAYLVRFAVSRVERQRIVNRTLQSLRAENEPLDRLLADLGQYAYIEKVDLLGLYPSQPTGKEGEDEGTQPQAELRQRAETWAARIDAEQLRNLAVLAREEARLSSELLQFVEARRQDGAWRSEPTLREEFELMLGRLAAVRVEKWVQERARGHCQSHQAQLLATLESMILHSSSPAGRPPPNLLLLGSLLTSHRALATTRAVEPWFTTVPGRSANAELSPTLFQPLWRFQDRLLPRTMLSARVGIERSAYDMNAVRSALLMLAVIAGTVLLCAGIAWWAILGS